MELFDSHCHLDFPQFDDDRERILSHCRQLGVAGIVVPGVTRRTWTRLLKLCQQHAMLHPALGLHPQFLSEHDADDVAALAETAARHAPVAIGEIGLDFYAPDHDQAAQQALFEAQLEVAEQLGLPVILHVRKAHDAVLACLRRRRIGGGIVHAFSGSRQQAEHYLGLGFKLGFGGAMTHERAQKLRRLASSLPPSALVLETDAPDMAPAWHARGPNTPEYLPRYCQLLAQLRQQTVEEVAERTTHNLRQVLALP